MEEISLSSGVFQFTENEVDVLSLDRGKPFFRDIMTPTKLRPQVMAKRDLIAENIATISFFNEDRLLPKFHLDEQYLAKLSRPWDDGVVLKLMGNKIPFFQYAERAQVDLEALQSHGNS